MARKSEKFNFETSITALEALVEKMEAGEFALEESIKQFETGVSLARACQKALREAEQKVLQLTEDEAGKEALVDFDSASDES